MSEFEDIFNKERDKQSKKEEIEKLSRFSHERQLNDIVWLLNDEQGRRFLWRLFNLSEILSFSFSGDPLYDARTNGKQSVGSIIQKDVIEVGGFKILDVMAKEYEILRIKEKEIENQK